MEDRSDRQNENCMCAGKPVSMHWGRGIGIELGYILRKKHILLKSISDDSCSLKIRDENGEIICDLSAEFILDNVKPAEPLEKGRDYTYNKFLYTDVYTTLDTTLSYFVKRLNILLNEAEKMNADDLLVLKSVRQFIKLYVPQIFVAHTKNTASVVNFRRILEKVSSMVLRRKSLAM